MNPVDERHRLAEIRQHLTADDPGLARVLATGRRSASARAVRVLAAVLAAVAVGLLAVALGFEFASPVLVLAGGVLTVVLPAAWILFAGMAQRVKSGERAAEDAKGFLQ
ncbi:DUF3040 domain-containing protein [Amycolatopsis benzoatilytica]|uniref:DUF3040 domain-containing protein n=1 Tax=Amycolatopsis benzoatilytica TaxID=346045 RepID=UPI00037FD706|nr:DUF3040 domain-containing protein [Amycolatopsis benzoatilytica]